VRFSGYDVSNFKIFVFCIGAIFAAIGGAMFTLQVGFMSPTLVGIVPSIEMVIFCAVGGRLSIVGAVYGALLVNFAKTSFSESFPELWLFAMGGLFIAVVMAFPNGLAGVYATYAAPKVDAFFTKLFSKTVAKNSSSMPLPSKPTSTKTESVSLPQGVIHEQ
jgi:urea transport system permease protein